MEPAHIHVRYAAWSTLQKEAAEQLSHRGLFLKEDLGLPQFAAVVLKVRCPDGREFDLPAEVVAVVPGSATAVQLLPVAEAHAKELSFHAAMAPVGGELPVGDPLVLRADMLDDDDSDAPADGPDDAQVAAALALSEDDGAPVPAEETAENDEVLGDFPDRVSVQQQIDGMTINEKRHAAMHGHKDTRLLLIRDHNKSIHPFVLKNPAITLDEVEQISKLTGVNPDVLHTIAMNRDWTRSQSIVRNVVKNPKTPIMDAIALVEKLAVSDLRAIVKSGSVRGPIQTAARKKVIPT